MKILAIESENPGVNPSDFKTYGRDEARMVYLLYQSDILREIYFTEDKNAVLILECENKQEAQSILSELPLVRNGLISFALSELKPYTGYTRLISE